MSFQLIQLEQGSPEWHEFRSNHIGASDAPIIMGESPWKTKNKLWKEKVGLETQGVSSRAMERGVRLEPLARQRYIEMTGIEVAPAVGKSNDYPWMIASFDGISKDSKSILEIKCPGEEDHALAKQGKIPKKYQYQLIQQMLVANARGVDYFSYSNADDVALVHLSFEHVEKLAKDLIAEEEKFWLCLQNLEEPALEDRDYVYQNHPLWGVKMNAYLSIREQIALLEKQEEQYKNEIVEMAKGSNARGSGFRLSKFTRKGNVDYSKIPELNGVNLELYRKEAVNGWRINKEK